jgi:hypothetical protein
VCTLFGPPHTPPFFLFSNFVDENWDKR